MEKKYQVFISSTYIDLVDQREQVQKAILKMGHLPVGMEMFNAADATQWEVIKRHIDNSDYYIVVIAHRYGSTDKDGVSYTEKEYDYAKSKGIPCLAFVIDDSVNWTPKFIEKGGAAKKGLEKFKQKVKGTHVNQWSTTEQLAIQVMMSLTETITIKPGRGWVRADEGAASPQVLEEVTRLSKENNELKIKLSDSSRKTDDIADVINILKSINFKNWDSGPEINTNLLDAYVQISPIFLKEISLNKLLYNTSSFMEYLNIYESYFYEKYIIEPFIQTCLMLDLIETSYPGVEASYCLTSKGKTVSSRLLYSVKQN